MSVISQDLANKISVKLTEKSRQAAEKLHVEYRELATQFYEEQTPKEVKDCLKKHPDWFYTRSSMILNEHGFNWEYVTSTRPVICNSNTECYLKLNSKISKQLTEAKRKWEKAKGSYEKLQIEAKQALLALKTYNNIRKELPEASSMLPPPISNALVVDFSSLKRKLKNQPDEKKQLTATN